MRISVNDHYVFCQQCGAPIGQYVHKAGEDGQVFIQIGEMTFRDAWGWCACGNPWIFHASEKQLQMLVERVRALRMA